MDDGLGLDDLQQAGPVGGDVGHSQPVCRVPASVVSPPGAVGGDAVGHTMGDAAAALNRWMEV
jgi:hypothetical protein